jgi:nitrite reductase (NADH) large subunit
MAGFGIQGTFVLRDADDAVAVRDFVQRHGVRRAAVVGAGLLGLEAAEALLRLGATVRVRTPAQVLDRQVDFAASELLAAQLNAKGIELVTEAAVRSLDRDAHDRVATLTLTADAMRPMWS